MNYIVQTLDQIKTQIEPKLFGVSLFVSKLTNINVTAVRIAFIYATFLSFGSSVLVYFTLASLMDFKKYFSTRKHIWE